MTFRKNKFLVFPLVGATIIAFTPSAASAASFTAIVKVGGLIATGIGLLSDSLTLSSLTNWDNLSDDHPLYSTDTVSPTITVSATKTTFDLLIDQPLKLDEFVDDVPVQISGEATIRDGQSEVKAWNYKLTFTYEHDTTGLFTVENTLDTSGVIQHIIAPHPDLGETIEGAVPLDVDATVTKTATITSTVIKVTDFGELKKEPHNNGPHFDELTENRLEFSCCTNTFTGFGNVTKWEYKVAAKHREVPPPPPIPEPLTIFGSATALGFVASFKRKLKSSKSTVKETINVG